MKVVNWIVGIILLISLILNGILIYKQVNQSVPERLEIHDTIIVKQDSIIEKTIYQTYVDTCIIHDIVYMDSVIKVTDTIRVPIEHKVSEFNIEKDSLRLNERIWHSGYRSVIDSIQVEYDWQYTIPKPQPKRFGLVWNVGLYTGYGINFNNGQYYFSPEVGIGGSIGFGGLIK